MRADLYKKSFDLFLRATDEKKRILKFIEKNIKLDKKSSFLDIGGGDGTLALTIAGKVKKTLIIEPNKYFFTKIKNKKNINVINSDWESIKLKDKYDFILAAYVVTYFPEKDMEQMIKKMYDCLCVGGKLLILSVNAQRGSWREVHTLFYKLMKYKYKSSDVKLKEIVKNFDSKSKTFKSEVVAKDEEEMLKILSFDFLKYPKEFVKHKKKLKLFLQEHQNNIGCVLLKMVHNAYIITKK